MPIDNYFYMPAEWHPHRCCWMAWPTRPATWRDQGLERARAAFVSVAQAIAMFEPVMMLVNKDDMIAAKKALGNTIEIIEASLDDAWMRDIGPTFLINNQHELAGVDWIHNAWGGLYESYQQDDKIAALVTDYAKATHFRAPLVLEGGSIHVDGEGTLLTTRECLLNQNRNPHLSQAEIEQYLKDYTGAQKIIWLNRGLFEDETDGHIDEIATFVAPGKVLALITHDKNDVNYAALQENLALLQQATDAKGRALEVLTIEQPEPVFKGTERLTLSYMNFYLANQGIVMPKFNQPRYDDAARDTLAQLFPAYKIIQIDNAIDIFAGGGGLHCITQQQPI